MDPGISRDLREPGDSHPATAMTQGAMLSELPAANASWEHRPASDSQGSRLLEWRWSGHISTSPACAVAAVADAVRPLASVDPWPACSVAAVATVGSPCGVAVALPAFTAAAVSSSRGAVGDVAGSRLQRRRGCGHMEAAFCKRACSRLGGERGVPFFQRPLRSLLASVDPSVAAVGGSLRLADGSWAAFRTSRRLSVDSAGRLVIAL